MQMPGSSNNTGSDPSVRTFFPVSLHLQLDLHRLHIVVHCSVLYLSAGKAALLCHGSVLLLEALAESLRALEEFVDAAHDATLLLGEKGLGGEVGDAVGEAALDEVGVHLQFMLALIENTQGCSRFHHSKTYVHEVLHLLALHTALQLALLSGVQPVAKCGQLHAISDRRAQCAACLLRRQTTMRPVSQARPAGSCVTYMSIPLMLGVCDLWI